MVYVRRRPEAAAGVAGELRGCCTGSVVPALLLRYAPHTHTLQLSPFLQTYRRNVRVFFLS